MKIAKEIKAAVQEQVDYDLDASDFTGWDEVESIIAAKLEKFHRTMKARLEAQFRRCTKTRR